MYERKQRTLPECPFYQEHQPADQQIRCEGIMDHCCTGIIFRSRADRDDYFRLMCCQHFRRCKIYAGILLAKYENGSK